MKKAIGVDKIMGELQAADLHGMGGAVVKLLVLWGVEKNSLGRAGHVRLPLG